jgi:hypothetical protein
MDEKSQEEPADKARAQTVHKTDPKKSAAREATRDPSSTRRRRRLVPG